MEKSPVAAKSKKPDKRPPDHSWLDRVRVGFRYFEKPHEYLLAPPSHTGITDLHRVKVVLDVDASIPGSLLVSLLKSPAYLKTAQAQRASDLVDEVSKSFAGRMAHKDVVSDVVNEFLESVDDAIESRLREGEESTEVFLSADFGEGLRPLWSKERSIWLQAGLVDHLAKAHPIRKWPPLDWFEIDGHPAAILGSQVPGLSDAALGKARAFYFYNTAKKFTRELRIRQVKAHINAAEDVSPEKYLRARETLRRVESAIPPKPKQPAPATEIHSTLGWADALEEAVEAWRFPHHYFAKPEPDVGIADLLAVRTLFAVDDEQDRSDPVKYASQRFASRCAGTTRKQELIDMARPLLINLDRAIATRIETGLLWAAKQVEKGRLP
jgi:hypothetical protein